MKDVLKCYLPYGAKSAKVVENARVAILVEGLMRQLLVNWGAGEVQRSLIVEGMEQGAIRRRRGVKTGLGTKKVEEENSARKWLEEAEERISWLVEAGWPSDQ